MAIGLTEVELGIPKPSQDVINSLQNTTAITIFRLDVFMIGTESIVIVLSRSFSLLLVCTILFYPQNTTELLNYSPTGLPNRYLSMPCTSHEYERS